MYYEEAEEDGYSDNSSDDACEGKVEGDFGVVRSCGEGDVSMKVVGYSGDYGSDDLGEEYGGNDF